MLLLHRTTLAGLAAALALLVSSAANALTIEALTTPFTGSDTAVRVALSEVDGDIRVDLSLEMGLGDLRGVFFDVSDDSLLEGLFATGEDVTGFATGGVINLGRGSNLHGGGTPCPCDFGVALGTPGAGKDDLQTASFVLSHDGVDLRLVDFAEQWVGVRVTSVGTDGEREGSAKLSGTFAPIPEPSTALLVALGLAAVGRARRRDAGAARVDATRGPRAPVR